MKINKLVVDALFNTGTCYGYGDLLQIKRIQRYLSQVDTGSETAFVYLLGAFMAIAQHKMACTQQGLELT